MFLGAVCRCAARSPRLAGMLMVIVAALVVCWRIRIKEADGLSLFKIKISAWSMPLLKSIFKLFLSFM
ncbi:hypothetical protein IUJ34_23105 [Klebsiella pneumoniae subsp. pneumoniae]|uniref:Uncharacterized protein n=1 Tax=Klebsiella pneumoniae subsp. pneumoniae TaxID=72407 RepID=A0A7S9E1N9_KLEPN|nr:hypothetical protein IUJ34_23105 [Klebsiella pneumoniae subsp. pneumoniae]